MNNRTKGERRYYIGFCMRTLLVVVMVVGAYLAGHRTGFHTGYSKAAAEYGGESFYGSYDVSDLVIPLKDGREERTPVPSESISDLNP